MDNEETKVSNVIPLIAPDKTPAPELIVLGEIPTPELADQPLPEAPPLVFKLVADGNGISELEMTRDVDFIIAIFMGLSVLIARTMNDSTLRRSPTVTEFFREMTHLSEQRAAMDEKAKSETPVN